MADVVIRGLNEFESKLRGLSSDSHNFLVRATNKAVLYTQDQVPPYPSPAGQPYPFVSMRQFLFVVISIIQGTIEVPYKRTGSGGIGGSITTEVREIGADVVGVIGSNKDYAPWVISSEVTPMGAGPQSAYHKNVWWTLQEVVEKAWDGIVRVYQTELDEFIRSNS